MPLYDIYYSASQAKPRSSTPNAHGIAANKQNHFVICDAATGKTYTATEITKSGQASDRPDLIKQATLEESNIIHLAYKSGKRQLEYIIAQTAESDAAQKGLPAIENVKKAYQNYYGEPTRPLQSTHSKPKNPGHEHN